MANQTNVLFNPTSADITVTLNTASVTVPAYGKTADAGVLGTDLEYNTVATTALVVTKAPLTYTTRQRLKEILRHRD